MNTLILLIFTYPLFTWDGYFEGPKILLLLFSGLAITLFWLYRILVIKKTFKFNTSDWFYALWILTIIVSSLIGVHPLESIIGGSYRKQGVLFFLTLWLINLTIRQLNTKQSKLLSKFIGYTVIIESIVVLVQYITGNLHFGKPLGTIGEVNAVAGFLVIGSYYVIQYLPFIFLPIVAIAISLTGSWSGLIAFIPLVILFTKKLNIKFQKTLTYVLVFFGAVFMIFAAFKPTISPFENRLLIWKLGIDSIVKKPLLGYGAESGEIVFNLAYSNANLPLNSLIIDRTHNLYLDVAMWSGIIGLLFFSFFLIYFYRQFRGDARKYALMSFLIYSFFQPISIVHWLLLFSL